MNPSTGTAPTPMPKRRIRNYLLNPRFQLKYSGMIVGVAVLLMLGLGVVIRSAANTAAHQASAAADQAENAMRESLTSSRIIRMEEMARSADNPELVRTIEDQLAQTDRVAARNLQSVREGRAEIERNRMLTLYTLGVAGTILVLVLGAMAIVITHKIMGPVFKLKRLLGEVGAGSLQIKDRLRRGDELEDLFQTFLAMVESLRSAQQVEIGKLSAAIQELEKNGAAPESLTRLRELEVDMQRALEGQSRMSSMPQ